MRSVTIDEKTKIPLSILLLGVTLTASIVAASGMTTWQVNANTGNIKEIKTELSAVQDRNQEQDRRLLELTGEFRADLREIKAILKERGRK